MEPPRSHRATPRFEREPAADAQMQEPLSSRDWWRYGAHHGLYLEPSICEHLERGGAGEEAEMGSIEQALVLVIPTPSPEPPENRRVRNVGDRDDDPGVLAKTSTPHTKSIPGIEHVLEHIREDDAVRGRPGGRYRPVSRASDDVVEKPPSPRRRSLIELDAANLHSRALGLDRCSNGAGPAPHVHDEPSACRNERADLWSRVREVVFEHCREVSHGQAGAGTDRGSRIAHQLCACGAPAPHPEATAGRGKTVS